MSLDSYANLKQAIERFSHRNDISDMLDDFIDLAENKIDNSLRLRSNELRATASASTSERFLALPDRFLEMRRLSLISGTNTRDIEYKAPEALRQSEYSGEPKFFTITSQIEFDRTPASAYTIEMSYYARLNPLSSSNTTNNVLTDYPNLYLYGALSELHRWARDEQTAVYYEQVFMGEIEKANYQDNRGRYGAAPTVGLEAWTP